MNRISIILLLLSASLPGIAQSKKPAAKPAAKKVAPAPIQPAVIERGKAVYNTYCVACHQSDGGGVPSMNAPLVKGPHVLGAKTPLISIVLNGMQGVEINGETYSNIMPANNFLTDQQIADVLTYVRNNFGNKASAVTVAEVAAARNKK